MSAGWVVLADLGGIFRRGRAGSLWYQAISTGCCADEVLQSFGCRYDLERFGCVAQANPRQSDLLFVSGSVNRKLAPKLREVYDAMPDPKYVISVGSCANCGGPFSIPPGYSVTGGIEEVVPVDVYVPGCPPRPEAIMNGLLTLQEKIRGSKRSRQIV